MPSSVFSGPTTVHSQLFSGPLRLYVGSKRYFSGVRSPVEWASARIKELKDDKSFQAELKASTMLHQVLTECGKLIARGGKINLQYAVNKKIVVQVRSGVAALKKSYPKSKAAGKVEALLLDFGFRGG